MGLGLHGGGLHIARWLARQGARLTVTDLKNKKELETSLKKLKPYKNIKYVLGRHRAEDFQQADLIIQNPGVRRESKYLKLVRRYKIPVENEASLFFKLSPAPIIGVTGTRGKSTTTSLLYEIFKKHNPKTLMAGNIRQVVMFEVIDKVKLKTPVILELSSWQLETLDDYQLSPHISLITNIYPDHLNRYKNLQDYVRAKKIIFKHQQPDDLIVLNRDNFETKKLGKEVPGRRYWFSKKYFAEENGVFIKKGLICFRQNGREIRIIKVKDVTIKGEHNLENVLGAVAVARISAIPVTVIKSVLKKYPGLDSRQELIRTYQGVKFYNDTTATTPEAVIAALKTLAGNKNVILIAGGSDKKLAYGNLARAIEQSVKVLILLPGTATKKIIKALHPTGDRPQGEKRKSIKTNGLFTTVDNIQNAVRLAFSAADKGDIVLLSPGAASFGLFVNEFDRGQQFIETVQKLK